MSTIQAPAHQRAYVGDVKLVFGPMATISVDAVSQGVPNVAKATEFNTFSADTLAPANKLSFVMGSDGKVAEGPFTEGEVVRGRTLDDGTVITFDAEEVAQCKTGGLDPNLLTVVGVPRAELLAVTRPAGTGFRLRPTKKSTAADRKAYAALVALVSDPKNPVAYVGDAVLKGSRGFYRLDVWLGQLYLERLVHPAELAVADELDIDVTKAELASLRAALVSQVEVEEHFVPAAHRYDVAAAIEAKVAEKAKAAKKGPKRPAAKEVESNITDILAKSIEKANAEKTAPKRRTRAS